MAYLTHQKYYQIVTSKENEASADFWIEGIYSNPGKASDTWFTCTQHTQFSALRAEFVRP